MHATSLTSTVRQHPHWSLTVAAAATVVISVAASISGTTVVVTLDGLLVGALILHLRSLMEGHRLRNAAAWLLPPLSALVVTVAVMAAALTSPDVRAAAAIIIALKGVAIGSTLLIFMLLDDHAPPASEGAANT